MSPQARRAARRLVHRVAADHLDRLAFVLAARTRRAHGLLLGSGAAEGRHLGLVFFLIGVGRSNPLGSSGGSSSALSGD